MSHTTFYVTGEPLLHQGRELLTGQELPDVDKSVGERLVTEGRASTSRPDPTDPGVPNVHAEPTTADPDSDATKAATGPLVTPEGERTAGSADGDGPVDYDAQDKDQLEQLAADRELEVTGTGSGGNVVKADLVKALQADDE